MEFVVRTEKELVDALKKAVQKDIIWVKPDFYNLQRNYIQTFAQNRKMQFQECRWGNRAVQITFY
jgi:hypothetical protein